MQILGISPQSSEHGRQLRERTIQDAKIDQASHRGRHDVFWHDPESAFPFRLISDPDCRLGREVGVQREGHWSGTMVYPTTFLLDSEARVRWRFQSKMASRRPSPVRLASMARAVTKGETVPEYVED